MIKEANQFADKDKKVDRIAKTKKITITSDKDRLTKEQTEKMIKEAEQFADKDKKVDHIAKTEKITITNDKDLTLIRLLDIYLILI